MQLVRDKAIEDLWEGLKIRDSQSRNHPLAFYMTEDVVRHSDLQSIIAANR